MLISYNTVTFYDCTVLQAVPLPGYLLLIIYLSLNVTSSEIPWMLKNKKAIVNCIHLEHRLSSWGLDHPFREAWFERLEKHFTCNIAEGTLEIKQAKNGTQRQEKWQRNTEKSRLIRGIVEFGPEITSRLWQQYEVTSNITLGKPFLSLEIYNMRSNTLLENSVHQVSRID